MVESPVAQKNGGVGSGVPVRALVDSTVMASTPIVAELHHAVRFKEWLASHGGSFHPRVRYSPGECDRSRLGAYPSNSRSFLSFCTLALPVVSLVWTFDRSG